MWRKLGGSIWYYRSRQATPKRALSSKGHIGHLVQLAPRNLTHTIMLT